MNNETDELVRTIREAIEKRGFFLLMDDRLALITGEPGGHQNGQQPGMIRDFAERNGWQVKQEEEGVTFHKSGEDPVDAGIAKIMEKFEESAPPAP